MCSTWYGVWRFKGLTRRIDSDKRLRDKAFNIAKNPKYDRYPRGFTSMVYKVFDKKTSAVCTRPETLAGSGLKKENISNKGLAEKLHKSIIRKFKKKKFTHFLEILFGVLILLICN